MAIFPKPFVHYRIIMVDPIFILGVPRSGTTLLRVILDSHPLVAGAPETGWITGGYCQTSVRGLVDLLSNDTVGAVKNLTGVNDQTINDAARSFLDCIFMKYLDARRKKILVIKTPDDIPYLSFIHDIYPSAQYIHIVRDGRDVACSTVSQKDTFFDRMVLKEHGELTVLNSLKRWVDWEQKTQEFLKNKEDRSLALKYEDLVARPEAEIARICEFINVNFDAKMLGFYDHDHELPTYEAGSTSVRQQGRMTNSSVGRWQQEIPENDWSTIDELARDVFTRNNYPLCSQFLSTERQTEVRRKWWRMRF